MSNSRLAVLLLCAVSIGVLAALLIAGNTSPVSLHFGPFDPQVETPLWLVVGLAFLAGAVTVVVLVATRSLSGSSYKILIGSQLPSGVMARFCGPLPRLGSIAINVSRPSSPMR